MRELSRDHSRNTLSRLMRHLDRLVLLLLELGQAEAWFLQE
jgi:hypothetical protein